MNSPLKKLDHSVFDGLTSEYAFAAVDANGWAFAYEQRPYLEGIDGFNCSGWIQRIPGKFDATDWQNSLIDREELPDDTLNQKFEFIVQLSVAAEQKPKSLRRGDLVEYDDDIWMVIGANYVDDGYWIYEMTGKGRQDYVKAKDLTRIGSIRKKIKRLKAQFIGDEK